MTRDDLRTWIERYEQLWRTDGTDRLGELFADDVVYLPGPWDEPVAGLDELGTFWDAERDGADETFTMTVEEIVAVDGETGVAQLQVEYGNGDRWRDLWIVRLDDDGRCVHFEEWPFAPRQPDGH